MPDVKHLSWFSDSSAGGDKHGQAHYLWKGDSLTDLGEEYIKVCNSGSALSNALPINVPDGQEYRVLDLDSSCTEAGHDMYDNPQHTKLKCCPGSEEKVESCRVVDTCYVCREEPPSPASGEDLCGGGKVVSRAGNSNAWSVLDGQEITNSCGQDYHIAPTEMCEGDSTSIIFQKNDQPACMGAKTCDFPLKDLVSIEADIAMYDCDLTWTAPLWTSPKSGWCTTEPGAQPGCPVGGRYGDQALSGEIDFVETCLVGGTTTLATSLGTEFPKNAHGDSVHFENFFSPKGMQLHYSLKVTDLKNGDAEMGVCDQGEATCTPETFKQKTTYTDWYSSHGCQHGTDCKFQLRSDIWAGLHPQCGGHYDQRCKISARNIKVKLNKEPPADCSTAMFFKA
eukprot:CAMPEP_0202796074 /NCGR_PEP_ID=MMETSP1388-20130828/91318_1 /ASSEMBLY_ACC=CAM_ASM_000864 /TAXON_ID=37098 /ORGANISM="Isochrysis sp, Strain CCMP1244" /LENGTH=394 /DNA_ID=CAMNT_0049465965 /DNA_START=17 /DNA_END=1201 /DNA_ORIENTATION=+